MTRCTPEQLNGKVARWLRTRPPAIQALIRRYPPASIVRSAPTWRHVVPALGHTAEVYSYFEPRDDAPEGLVAVVGQSAVMPDPLKGECLPESLVLVECPLITVEQVAEILDTPHPSDSAP